MYLCSLNGAIYLYCDIYRTRSAAVFNEAVHPYTCIAVLFLVLIVLGSNGHKHLRNIKIASSQNTGEYL